MKADLPTVLDVWERTADLHERSPGATAAEIEEAEGRIGRRLPQDMRDLYAAMNGADLFGGDLHIEPLLPAEEGGLSLTTSSDLLREWKWPIPPELVAFGSDGTGDIFGVWLPDEPAPPFIVHVGSIFEEASFAIVGDDLPSFLTGWTAIYLIQQERGDALDLLEVPAEFRDDLEITDEWHVEKLLGWSSPNLPDPEPDPYERPLTAEQLRAFARSRS